MRGLDPCGGAARHFCYPSIARVVGAMVTMSADSDALPHFDEDWDAAELGCGDLVVRLRFRVKAMRPGQVLRVRALDPGAPQDLPAWCRLTGETLLYHDPERRHYYIRRNSH